MTDTYHECPRNPPRTNRLYGAQLLAGALPEAVLARSPRFDGSLVFVNFGPEPSTLEGTLHCMINGSAVPVPVPLTGLALEPFAPRRIALSSLLAGPLNGAAGAMCSGQFTFTGPPGHVTGRYYAASESKVYGAYVKLEPFVGRAYSEVYWTTEEDFVPILTVTNFSEEEDDIEIYISRRERLALLHSEPLAPGASLTVNVRELLERLRTEGKFTDEYGGSYIRTRKPTGKLMVKQHSISQRRLMMAPYYGGYDYITWHLFSMEPPSTMNIGTQAEAAVYTCYAGAGCFVAAHNVTSTHPWAVAVTNYPAYQQRPVTLAAQSVGSGVRLVSEACCDVLEQWVIATSRSITVNCPVPTGEQTASAGWADSSNEPAIHRFVQQLLPTGTSFVARTITESDSSPATDSCWFQGSMFSKTLGVTGGDWTVGSDQRWGPDEVGWLIGAFGYYQNERPSRGLPLPCEFQIFQRLTISSCGGNSSATVYRTNVQLRGVISASGATSQRDGVEVGRQLIIQ